jgi:hypothetical protein
MLDYARQHVIETLKNSKRVIMATSGPAGIQIGELPCEVVGLEVYLLVPKTSDLIFNLEHNHSVTVLTPRWEVKGDAELIDLRSSSFDLNILKMTEAEWCSLVLVHPHKIHVRRKGGWGHCETIDI